MPADLAAGFVSGAALIIAIGAQNAFVLRQGILRRHVLPIAAICALADALLIAAGIRGIGAALDAAPLALELARYGGAAFLFAYGAAAARRAWRPRGLEPAADGGQSLAAALLACLAFTFLNPHVYLDTVVLLGTLASQRGEDGRWAFGAGAMAASLVWFFALAYGARLLAPYFARPGAWRVLDGGIAVTMFGLGGGLLAG